MPSVRDRVLHAAIELFAQHGLNGASTKAIADAAGVAETTFFHYFPTKYDALLAALEDIGSRSGLRAGLVDDALFERDFAAGARTFARRFAKLLLERDHEQRVVMYAALGDPSGEVLRPLLENVWAPLAYHLGTTIAAAVSRGIAKAKQPHVAARVLIDTLVGSHYFLHWYCAKKMPLFNCAHPEDRIVEIWLRGILVTR